MGAKAFYKVTKNILQKQGFLEKLLRIIGRVFVGVIVFGLVWVLSGICNVIPRDVWI